MTLTGGADWTFHNPTRIRFGAGSRSALAALIAGKSVLIVTTQRGRRQFLEDPVLRASIDGSRTSWVDSVEPNPGLAETQAEIDRLKGQDFACIVAFGGGSAMDAAKALAAALSRGATTSDLASLIAAPATTLGAAALPIHALPTTSGTGAEVTPFATIWDHARKAKLSLTSPLLFPATAIVDPELAYALPMGATLSTGLDALNQAFESVWNRNRSAMTMTLAARAIDLSLSALDRLHHDLEDHGARIAMSESSMLAGLCISQTRTAVCHAISYPLTAHFGLSHGMACAFTMAAVSQRVLAHAPHLLEAVAERTGDGSGAALVERLTGVLARIDVPGVAAKAIPDLAALLDLRGEMYTPGRSDNFVLPVTNDLLGELLSASF